MVRQRVYQIAAGYEDCNDADFLRIDPALRLALGKDQQVGAGQSMLSRLENDILGNSMGLEALEAALTRSTDALLRRKNKKRLIIDLDSTEDPAHGKQEGVAYNGHFAKNCFHPLFWLHQRGRLSGGQAETGERPFRRWAPWSSSSPWWSATGPGSSFSGFGATPPLPNLRSTSIAKNNASPISSGYRPMRTWIALVAPHLGRPVGRPPKSGIQVKIVDLHYQAKSWSRPRRVVAKIEWHRGELFPRIGFVVTNSRLPAGKVTKVYNGRAEIENRIKEGKNTLRWDKTSCQRFEANQARLKMGVLAYNLLHMIRQFYVWGEEVRRSMDWLIKRLIKVGARVSYHARRWYVHVASAFPLAHHYRAVLAWGP